MASLNEQVAMLPGKEMPRGRYCAAALCAGALGTGLALLAVAAAPAPQSQFRLLSAAPGTGPALATMAGRHPQAALPRPLARAVPADAADLPLAVVTPPAAHPIVSTAAATVAFPLVVGTVLVTAVIYAWRACQPRPRAAPVWLTLAEVAEAAAVEHPAAPAAPPAPRPGVVTPPPAPRPAVEAVIVPAEPQAAPTAQRAADGPPSPRLGQDVKALLAGIPVFSAIGQTRTDAGSLIPDSGRCALFLLTNFADFDSWEQAKRLVDELPRLQAAGVKVVCIGIGGTVGAVEFCARTNLPRELMFADPIGECHKALKLQPGFGRAGGLFGELPLPGWLKLLVMCAGIGSRNTLQEVFRGYLGDRSAPPVFQDGSNVDLEWKRLFDFVGTGYQRPFELATYRLLNMVEILTNWEQLAPTDDQFLLQRGGSFVLEGGQAILSHRDTGILGYAEPRRVADAALEASPGQPPSVERSLELVHAAARRETLEPKEVFAAIRVLEKQRKQEFAAQQLRGQWRLAYTSGDTEDADVTNLARAGGGGYFPLNAVQSFDPPTEEGADGRIRNGIYQGPLAFFFDGPMAWLPGKNLLEFTFDKVAVGVSPELVASRDIQAGQWRAAGVSIQVATRAKPGKNPFFKIIHVDEQCIVARGRGGGMAVWQRLSPEPLRAPPGQYAAPAL